MIFFFVTFINPKKWTKKAPARRPRQAGTVLDLGRSSVFSSQVLAHIIFIGYLFGREGTESNKLLNKQFTILLLYYALCHVIVVLF